MNKEGWNVFLNENKEIVLNENEDSNIAYIADKLMRQQLAIYRIQEEKQSLEDIFLQITHKGGRVS